MKVQTQNGHNFGRSSIKIRDTNITFNSSKLNLDISSVNFSFSDLKKGIVLPTFLSPLLAEEIGIHLGDGFLSAKRNDYRLKGHKIDERTYYLHFLKDLYKIIYNLDVSVKDYSDTIGFEISSKAIWDFKVNVLGITPGKKDNLMVPSIIKVNNEAIISSFLRGLYDTDGSVSFLAKYGKTNYYPVISLTQKSPRIIEDVDQLLQMLGFSPHVYHHRNEHLVVLNGYAQLLHFELKIGWNSPKHLYKVRGWKNSFMAAIV